MPVDEYKDIYCTDSLKVVKEMAPNLNSKSLDNLHKLIGGEPIAGPEGRCQMLLDIVRRLDDEEFNEFHRLCESIICNFSKTSFEPDPEISFYC